MSLVPIDTPGWRETKWSKVPCLRIQCNGWGLNPRPPDLEFEVLTTRPHMLHHESIKLCCNSHQFSHFIVAIFCYLTWNRSFFFFSCFCRLITVLARSSLSPLMQHLVRKLLRRRCSMNVASNIWWRWLLKGLLIMIRPFQVRKQGFKTSLKFFKKHKKYWPSKKSTCPRLMAGT